MENFEYLPYFRKPEPDFGRLKTVLTRSGRPDYVPVYELYANVETIRKFMDGRDAGPSHYLFYLWAGYDYVPVWPDLQMELGSLVDTSKPYPITGLSSLEAYAWPRKEEMGASAFEQLKPILPEGMCIIGQTGGPFEMAQQLTGYQNLCYFLYDEPELVERLFFQIGRIYEDLYTLMAAQPGVGALVISDDMGYKNGPMVGYDTLRRYVKPIHAKIVQIAHQAGLPVILHSCGSLGLLLDEWIDEVGVDAKHSFEDGILPVTQAYQQCWPRAAILGGYDLNRLCHDTPKEVYAHCRELIEMGRQGGYALGSGNSIPDYVPVDNYLAMLNAARDARLNP